MNGAHSIPGAGDSSGNSCGRDRPEGMLHCWKWRSCQFFIDFLSTEHDHPLSHPLLMSWTVTLIFFWVNFTPQFMVGETTISGSRFERSNPSSNWSSEAGVLQWVLGAVPLSDYRTTVVISCYIPIYGILYGLINGLINGFIGYAHLNPDYSPFRFSEGSLQEVRLSPSFCQQNLSQKSRLKYHQYHPFGWCNLEQSLSNQTPQTEFQGKPIYKLASL